ncbi:uncharacterized protein [Mytilus edulis]|uniref:uncharacterized protein n=1 Tax=Mytilus edulis TaxID=6550 RepID=UPI0039EEF53C
MATERAFSCSPCDYQHDTTPAVKWCIDCTEALCLSCFGVHNGLKISRNHNVIGIEDHKALQGIISNLSEVQRCDQHDKPFEYFCPLHDEVVCIKCIQTKHSQCTGWLTTSEAAGGVKSSVAKETIKQDLEDMIGNVEELIENHEKERINNQNACKSLKDEATKVVRRIIQKVEDLEAEFVKTVDVQHQRLSSNIGSRAIELKDKLQKVKDLKDRMNAFEGYASDTQMFLGIRKISTELSDSIKEIKYVTDDPIVVLKELKIADPVESFLSTVSVIGHVQNDHKHILFQPTKLQKVQSHVSVTVSKSIEDIEIQKIVKINVSKHKSKSLEIWSAVILPNKQLIFNWNQCKNLEIYSSDGEFVRYQSLHDIVRYMAIVDSNRLAFSNGSSKVVSIFNINTQKTEQKITFDEDCYGMSYDDRRLYIIGRTEIFSVDLSDDLVHISSVSVNVSSVVFLSVNRDKIYYIDHSNYTVYCCKQNMEVIWSFKNEVMEFPTDRPVWKCIRCMWKIKQRCFDFS